MNGHLGKNQKENKMFEMIKNVKYEKLFVF
jgi:hypothetical protein